MRLRRLWPCKGRLFRSQNRVCFIHELLGSRFQIGDLAVADLLRILIQQLRNFGVFRRIWIHQGGRHLGLADIVNIFDNFLADFVQRRSDLFAHLGGDGDRTLDANYVITFGAIGKEVDKADRGIFHVAVGANAPEHSRFEE